MSFFKRRQTPSIETIREPEAPSTPLSAEPERPRTPSNGEKARQLLREAQARHNAFAAETVTKGMPAEAITAAAADAINSGVLPRMFAGGLRFRNSRSPIPVIVLHGVVPPEALWVSEGNEHVPPSLSTLDIRSLPKRDQFPDGPTESDFYAEERFILNTDTPSVSDLAGTLALMQALQVVDTPEQG